MWSPWKTQWALALVKGIREPHEASKEKIILTSVGAGKVTVALIWRPWVRFPPGPDSHRGQKKFFTSCGSLIPFSRANAHMAQWVFHGLHIALKFTLES